MTHRNILAPGRLDWRGYTSLVQECHDLLLGLRTFDYITMQLTAVKSVTAAGLACLASTMLVMSLRKSMKAGRCLRPREDGANSLLAKLGLYELIADPLRGFAQAATRLKAVGGLARVQDESKCEEIAQSLINFACEHCGGHSTTSGALRFCLAEVLENVFRHADSSIGAVVCAQALSGTGWVELAVADAGVGLLATLGSSEQYRDVVTDERTALRYALRPEVTSKPKAHSGVGLFFTRKLVLASGGDLLLHSGGRRLTFVKGKMTEEAVSRWPGTFVVMRFGSLPEASFKQVFSLYRTRADQLMELQL